MTSGDLSLDNRQLGVFGLGYVSTVSECIYTENIVRVGKDFCSSKIDLRFRLIGSHQELIDYIE